VSAYAALLRGVNVSGHRKVAMADLRGLLTGLGFDDVRTLLASGNATFSASGTDAAALERLLEAALLEGLGLGTRVMVRTGDDLRAVLAAHPFEAKADNGAKMVALFLSEDPAPSVAVERDPRVLDQDNIAVGERVVYQWCPDGISDAPPLGPWLEREWKVSATGRNWNTVGKLAALL
jgi:uncharacterized protein (DUF1697 family)